jgi:NAD(P)-dependent dehydrogenase (short-subunit alcohol dehydrogenase family)
MKTSRVYRSPDLEGKIALVAGATRGAGRGIAIALGEAGATVYNRPRTAGLKRSKKPLNWSPLQAGAALP